jgi:hypothetical protein
MNDQELLKNVNPSYTTGKGCLVMLAGTGDPDAIELSGIIDLSELPQNDPMPENQTTRDIVRSYMVGQDARYSVWNQIAADSDCDVIIDLPWETGAQSFTAFPTVPWKCGFAGRIDLLHSPSRPCSRPF